MGDQVIKSLERERKRAVRAYGESTYLTCLSEQTDDQVLCDLYSKLQCDVIEHRQVDEAKWLKSVIEKTIVAKTLAKHGFSSTGRKI